METVLQKQADNEALAKAKGTPVERRDAARYFAGRMDPEFLPILKQLGADSDDKTRYIAMDGIIRLDLPEETTFFLQGLNDPHPSVRMLAAFGLRERGSPEIVDAISLRYAIEQFLEVKNCLKATLESILYHPKTPSDLKYLLSAISRAVPPSPVRQ